MSKVMESVKSKALQSFSNRLKNQLFELKNAGTFKSERIISSSQSGAITLQGQSKCYLNFCANNYLGLASNEYVVRQSIEKLKTHGSGLSSVRFICGTQDIHKQLEKVIRDFHARDDAIAYISCFDANGGIFESLLGPEDAVFSDELNHASIIDGVRLCKASKFRYNHRDMNHLKKLLEENKDKRTKLIVTDGVFSMDGTIAPLKEIVELAEENEALTMIDECHATGFFGPTGKGTEEYCDVMGKITLINSTLGKALGGAAGGYTTGPQIIIDWLRQKSRPYLFSNSLPPAIVGSAIAAFELISKDQSILKRLQDNTKLFRTKMKENGFTVIGDNHPICPVMMPNEATAVKFADKLLDKGIYVIGFTYPVVPKGKARIRVQMSSIHTEDEVTKCIDAFKQVKEELQL